MHSSKIQKISHYPGSSCWRINFPSMITWILYFCKPLMSLFLSLTQFLVVESSLKKMKITLRYLNICPDFLAMWDNNLIRKLRLISKIMMLQTGKQIITIHILSSVPRSKGNQPIEFVQLIEHEVRNTFLQKSCRNEVEILVPDLFLFFKKLYISSKQMASTMI